MCGKLGGQEGRGETPRLHVDGAAAGDDGCVLHRAADDLQRVVERALGLVDELLGAAAQHEGRRASFGALAEDVEALAAHLKNADDTKG